MNKYMERWYKNAQEMMTQRELDEIIDESGCDKDDILMYLIFNFRDKTGEHVLHALTYEEVYLVVKTKMDIPEHVFRHELDAMIAEDDNFFKDFEDRLLRNSPHGERTMTSIIRISSMTILSLGIYISYKLYLRRNINDITNPS